MKWYKNPFLLVAAAAVLILVVANTPFATFKAGDYGSCQTDQCGNILCSGSYKAGDDGLSIYLKQPGAVANYPACSITACYTEDGRAECYTGSMLRTTDTVQVYCTTKLPGPQGHDVSYDVAFIKSGQEYPCVLPPPPVTPPANTTPEATPVVVVEQGTESTSLPVSTEPAVKPSSITQTVVDNIVNDGQPVTEQTRCSWWDLPCWIRKLFA